MTGPLGRLPTRAAARRVAVAVALAATAATGCERRAQPAVGPEGRQSEGAGAAEGAESETATGAVEGWVRLADGASLPTLAPPADRFPDGCPPYDGETDALAMRLVGDRRLTDVLVNVTDYERGVPERTSVRRLEIDRCRLTPRLLSATRGDTLEIVNRTAHPFFPTIEGGEFMQAILEDQSVTIPLTRGGFRRVQCGLSEPCGVAFVVTLYHPLHTVTDAEGHFRVEGVPAGEPVTVSAFHPLFREPVATEVTVPAGGTVRVELAIGGAPPAAAPPAAAPPASGAEGAPAPPG